MIRLGLGSGQRAMFATIVFGCGSVRGQMSCIPRENGRSNNSASENGNSKLSELSMGWVDPRVWLGWVEIFQFLVGWVGSTTATVLKFERLILMHLKHG